MLPWTILSFPAPSQERVAERSRSRTPPNEAPSRLAGPRSSLALTRSTLGLTLGLAQLEPVDLSLYEATAPSLGTRASFRHIIFAMLVCLGLALLCSRLAALAHKVVLQESTGRTPAENRALRRLRGATRRLGGRWITDPPLRLPGLLPPQSEDESYSDSAEEAQSLLVPCAILRPGYTTEAVDIVVPIPATPGELTDVLQAIRQPEAAADFPQLIPALPQPGVGVATFVAYPDWPVAGVLICFDTTAIDGRLFVAKVPPYVCGRDLVQFAGLLPNLEYVALYNVDQEPTGRRGHQNAYCLVHGATANLCTDCGRHPTRYRDYIASATGAGVALCGVRCTTALAVCHPPDTGPSPAWHGALLDCKPLLESWTEIIVPGGYVPQRRIFDSLAVHVPAEWCLRLDRRGEAPGVVCPYRFQCLCCECCLLSPEQAVTRQACRLGRRPLLFLGEPTDPVGTRSPTTVLMVPSKK